MLTIADDSAIIHYGVFMMTYNYIEINPGIAGGSPVFKGTRIPLYIVLDFISAGNTIEEILQHYPQLTDAHIKEAVKYVSDSLKYEEVILKIPA